MYLPAHHPIAKELQALDYTQMREKFQEEHRVKFRYATLHKNINAHLANRLPLKMFLDWQWMRFRFYMI